MSINISDDVLNCFREAVKAEESAVYNRMRWQDELFEEMDVSSEYAQGRFMAVTPSGVKLLVTFPGNGVNPTYEIGTI